MVVDKRVGGGVLFGHEIVANASPDGNTLLLGAAGPLTVALMAATPFVLVVNPSVPANNLKELSALAKSDLVLQHIKSGKLKALAFTGRQHSVLLPDVPTMNEGGLRDYEAGSWYGILASASTSVSIINRINNDVHAALAQADVQKQLVAQGMETVNMSREQFNAILREDYEKWGKLIKESNIKLKLSNRMQSFLTLNCEICI